MAFTAGCFSPRPAPLKGDPLPRDSVTYVSVGHINDEQERQWGYVLDAFFLQENYSLLEPEHPLSVAVDRIGQRLAKVGGRPHLKYTFKVINDPTLANALATLGGFIYVGRGLFDILESEDELAAALGHEIGHIVARHVVKKEQRRQRLIKIEGVIVGLIEAGVCAVAGQAAIAATGGLSQAGELACRVGTPIAGELAASIADLGNRLILAKHSREDELEADKLGFQCLKLAGYSPIAAYSLGAKLKILAAREGFAENSIFATHPPSEERLQAIQQYLTGPKAP